MGLEFMTDEDLKKITEAAIRLDKEGIKPTEEVIEAISDGDEDIPIIICNFAKMRGFFWFMLESGVHFLKIERELDEEQFDAPHNVREKRGVPDPFRGADSG